MTGAEFWALVGESREEAKRAPRGEDDDFADLHASALQKALARLEPERLAAFDAHFRRFSALAYRWDLWAAATWIGGGCSDDGFTDFRACLVSLGKDLYESILRDPDALADVVERPDTPYLQSEGFQYLAGQLYEEKTGKELPPDPTLTFPAEPAGEEFDFDDAAGMKRRLPKLTARLPEGG
jgi:hypothetical protein